MPLRTTRRETIVAAAGVLVCLGAVAAFVWFHRAVLHETWSDENIHMYVASRVAEGASLYGDIHSARPPLALAPLVGLIALGLKPLLAARVTVLAAILMTGAVLLWAGNRLWGRLAAVSAFVLFLLSTAVASRASFTGINLVALWTTLCVVLVLMDRPLWAGFAGGVALMTGQHAIVVVLVSGVAQFMRRPRSSLTFAGGCLGVVVVVAGIAVALGGSDIWSDLVGRHLYHVRSGAEPEDMKLGWYTSSWLLDNLSAILPALLALVLGTREAFLGGLLGRLRARPTHVLAVLAMAHLLAVGLMGGGQALYLQPAFPLIALLAGAGVGRMVDIFRIDYGQEPSAKEALPSRVRTASAIALCVLAATVAGWTASSAMYGARDGREYPVLPHLRHVEMAALQRPVVVDDIAKHARKVLSPDGTIFGHATIADLVALKSGRRVSAELADFAPRWLVLGLVSRESLIERIEADNVELFVTPNWFWTKDREFSAYLERCYLQPVVFERKPGSGIPRILVFEHVRGPRPCGAGEAN